MKMNRARLKEIIRSVMSEEKDYEKYFRKELEKAGFSSPAEMSDDEKREFFNKIDSGWKGKNEGNAFGAAVVKAKKAGKDEFSVDGKKFPVKTEGNAFGAAVVKAKKAGKDEFSVDGKKFPVKEEKSKYYVEIDTPREVDSNRVKGEIKSFMKRGARAADIGLRMNFLTTDPKDMMNKFQKVKNHVYFANDTRRFESVKRMSEGKKTFKVNPQIGVVKYSISFHDGVGANKDGSAFSDLKTYKNKVELEAGIKDFKSKGYVMESLKVEGLAPDIAKHMDKIYKGFVKVEGDGTMIYDSPATAKKAADILNKNKIAASTDGKYLYIESKKF